MLQLRAWSRLYARKTCGRGSRLTRPNRLVFGLVSLNCRLRLLEWEETALSFFFLLDYAFCTGLCLFCTLSFVQSCKILFNTSKFRVGAVVRALAFYQCVPGSIPGPGVCGLMWADMWTEFVGSLLCSERFCLRELRFFPLPKNQHLIWFDLMYLIYLI